MYNRQGKYLHHALMYDMGEDYYVEGKRRVIAPNKKMAYADRTGSLKTLLTK